ncbi:MAG: alpha/beta hydrolase [Alphaproteobacteria bacterium]
MNRSLRWLCVVAVTTLVTLASAHAEDRWLTLPEPPAMPEAMESGYAPVNGIDMYYAVYGAGDPVLLIHGGLGHADVWASQVSALMGTHKVIVADSRGHGRSTRTAEPYGYDLMASDFLALLDYLKIDKVALVGWSDGGIIGLDIAMMHPERLTKLFAHAANVTVDGVNPDVMSAPAFAAYMERMGVDYKLLSKTPTEYDAFVEQISGMWFGEPAWTAQQLGTITTPTWVVLGDHDEAIFRDHTEKFAAWIPGAKLVILDAVGHVAMWQDPAGYTKAIEDFLAAP